MGDDVPLHAVEHIVTPGPGDAARRMRVPGGWFYLVEASASAVGAFVPDPAPASAATAVAPDPAPAPAPAAAPVAMAPAPATVPIDGTEGIAAPGAGAAA